MSIIQMPPLWLSGPSGPSTLLDGLVSSWRFDGDASDDIGANPGTTTSVTYGLGVFSANSSIYNGSSSYMAMNATPFRLTEFSFSCCVRFDVGGGTSQTLFSIWNETSGYILRVEHRALYAYAGKNNGFWGNYFSLFTMVPDTDYFICFTRESDGSVYLRINSSTETGNDNSGGTLIYNTNTVARIGVTEYTVGGAKGAYLLGKINRAAYWDRALSPAEITQLYNGGSPLTYPF